MNSELIHIIALKDNKIYDLQKENERLKKQVEKFREDVQIKDNHLEMIKKSSRDYQKAFEDVDKELDKWKRAYLPSDNGGVNAPTSTTERTRDWFDINDF